MATPKQFAAQLRATAKATPGKVALATTKATIDTSNDAKINAPVRTGNLRDSIKYETAISGTSVTGRVYAEAHYAPFVENGTSRMAAQPYMGPSFETHSAKWLEAMARLGTEVGG